MSAKRLLSLLAATTIAALIAGCGKTPSDVASPTCADLDKITDPVQQAELLKKCPRSGPAFKPSEEKKW